MTATPDLTPALAAQVLTLEDDLRARLEADAALLARWETEHRNALEAGRTAGAWESFRDDRITQAAVAWVLTTVFVRFVEDNALVSPVWIAGPPERRQEAFDAQLAYFRKHPEHTDREWLLQAVEHLKGLPATAALADPESPLWQVSPSGAAAERLLAFWRERDDDGALVRDLADPELSTRFLGDLYQDLSAHARETYALLQTPTFVEEFILDQTMEPALAERPLEGFRLIDPTCGSGHFLLGAFDRLVDRWSGHDPTLDRAEVVHRALDAVHGVDINPFAVAIARFRLTVTALSKLGLCSLERAPDLPLHLAVGDSLLHGTTQDELNLGPYDPDAALSGFVYSVEDLEELREILRPGRYDVVVGNPPYITVKDKALNAAYRARYTTCKGTYAMTVPFMERFFGLARPGGGDAPAGWTGQITSNSFMKREFGTKVIEDYLVTKDLRLVADTSGAYIPGHGTPTVILTGRNQAPQGNTVRAVLGIRGEPGRPGEPENGLVWRSIADHIGDPGYEDDWITVTDLDREVLVIHPWSLTGGGAATTSSTISEKSNRTLDELLDGKIGFASFPGADDAFFSSMRELTRTGIDQVFRRAVVTGDVVRNWAIADGSSAFVPYDNNLQLIELDTTSTWYRRQWPLRTTLGSTTGFGGQTKSDLGEPWWGWYRWVPARYRTPLSITFAFVATHNHFVLDRGGKVFKQSAPVIKLPEEDSEDDHLALLGVLNSSVACFWLKQNSQNKASAFTPSGMMDQPWSWNYEFTGTTLKDYPLPDVLPLERGRTLDRLAQQLAVQTPAAVAGRGTPTTSALQSAHSAYEHLRGRMIAEQEELDWETYGLYELVDADLTYAGDDLPQLRLGERAFEIVLARQVAAGEAQTTWFAHEKQRSTPITEIPTHWPESYRDLVQRRIDLIESDRSIGLLEKPEHKRRWSSIPWEKQQDSALQDWLLDCLEDRRYWFDSQGRPAPASIAQLADRVARDPELVGVVELWTGRKDPDLTDALSSLMVDQAVPYLAAHRLKDSGLRKRAAWERTWDLQRREDAGESVGTIPVPPKYTSADFRKQSWWQHRGKLDVPKERFILYPDAGRPTDPTALLGWAGWDHAEQSLALSILLGQREADGVTDDKLTPLVAGIAELQPWVEQWHADLDPTYGMSMAEFTRQQLEDRRRQVGATLADLAAWRPAPSTRGRKRKS
ncbi:BREX-2 system adenine-specific DNA-methyltransferase PglX [Georgenia sp. Z1344]|uniref:BREX-2 system adenine-specific DNA-methyltransferase PglX n=1 Tax=Georgenia sp. Z1344 TaxID=3416706 RepID=UPI003CEAB899